MGEMNLSHEYPQIVSTRQFYSFLVVFGIADNVLLLNLLNRVLRLHETHLDNDW